MKLRLVVLAMLIAVPGLSFAGTSCATPTIVPADGRIVDFDFVAAGGDNFYQFNAIQGRSYSIEVRQDYDDTNPDLAVSVFGVADAACATPLAVNGTVLRDTSAIEPPMPANTFRASMIAASTGTFRVRAHNNNGTTGRYISVKVSETTLYSPSFSTNQPFNTFYAILNTTSSPVTGTLTLTPLLAGGANGTPVPITITIPANGLASTNTSVPTFAAVLNRVGFATFAHNGPPGGVLISAAIANFTTSPAYNQVLDFKTVREQH